MRQVIITTGGTGGHIFPALAVAEEIAGRYPKCRVLFLGGLYGQEADLAVKAGLEFVGLPVRGVMGRGFRGVLAMSGMVAGIAKATGIVRRFAPQVVVGFGGYAAFAGVMAARLAGRRSAIHEQNAFPGLSNRVLGKVVDQIFLSMPDASGSFPARKCRQTGNPVRAGIAKLYEERRAAERSIPSGRPVRLLVLGGSQGAQALNEGMIAIADKLLDAGLEIRHQTGKTDYERTREAYQAVGAENVRVDAFIYDMVKAYSWADVVLCRAGASTLAEIACAGLPVVLSPFPHAARDHQRHNARYVAEQGAGLMLEQRNFYGDGANPAVLADCLLGLIADRDALAAMARRSLELAQPYAAANVVDGLERLLMK